MTQEDYQLLTGATTSYSESEWARFEAIAEARLASLLCLDELPETLADDLKLLLASFMYAMLANLGAGEERVKSKSVRNFDITFDTETARTAFSKISELYGDIIDKYSECGATLNVEKSGCWRCRL